MKALLLWLPGLALIALIGAAAAGEIPRWVLGGARMVVNTPMARSGEFPIPFCPGNALIWRGDSNVSGNRVGGPGNAFSAEFEKRLSVAAHARNEGRGGDTILTGPGRWSGTAKEDLVVIMYGTNDAAARGFLSTKQPVGQERFRTLLLEHIVAIGLSGAKVLVLAAPPAGSTALDRRIQPYRVAARRAAAEAGAWFLDPAEAFLSEEPWQVPLLYDAIHLSPSAHRTLGAWLARQVSCPGNDGAPLNGAMRTPASAETGRAARARH